MLTIYFLPIILVLVAATAVAIGLAVWLALRLKRLERRYQVLTTGTTGGNLETVLEDHVRQ
jgi:predicted permease